MKIGFVFLMLSFANYLYAKPLVMCWPSEKSPRLVLDETQTAYQVFITSPLGYSYLPQAVGPVSPSQLNWLQFQFKELSELGSSFNFTYSKNDCDFDSKNMLLNCSQPSINQIQNIKSLNFSAYSVIEKNKNSTNEKIKFKSTFEKDSNFYFYEIEFYKENCKKFENVSF